MVKAKSYGGSRGRGVTGCGGWILFALILAGTAVAAFAAGTAFTQGQKARENVENP